MNIFEVIKRPIVTEKATSAKEGSNAYVFEVDKNADKLMIRKSVEQNFKVKVKSVTTLIVPSKVKRFSKGHGRVKSWKKAVVTLSEGKIELFEGV